MDSPFSWDGKGPGCNAHLTLKSSFFCQGKNGRLLEFFFPNGDGKKQHFPTKKHEERRLEADCDPDYRTKTYGGQGGNGVRRENGCWFSGFFGSECFFFL